MDCSSSYVLINFGWKGPNAWKGGWSKGGLDVRAVDLVFKNATSPLITVHLPQNICPATIEKFPLTCAIKPPAEETQTHSLKVSTEQIQNLTIKARIIQKNPDSVTIEKDMHRSDRNIKLEIPKDLETGKTYTLVVASDEDFSLSAQLEAASDREELLQILGDLFLSQMILEVTKFRHKLSAIGIGQIFSQRNIHTSGIQAIKSGIEKIEEEILNELTAKIRTLLAKRDESKNLKKRAAFESEALNEIYDTIGDVGLKNIMRSHLQAFLHGEIPHDANWIMDSLADDFKNICRSGTGAKLP